MIAALLIIIIVTQTWYICNLQMCHFRILAPNAVRVWIKILTLLHVPTYCIAFDIRKMHQLNEVLGYESANVMIADFISRCIRQRGPRLPDLVGQYGGDEFVILTLSKQASLKIAMRLLVNADKMSAEMSTHHRDEMRRRTGGLVDGLAISMVATSSSSRCAIEAVRGAMDAANAQKSGEYNGDRATSGVRGTVSSTI